MEIRINNLDYNKCYFNLYINSNTITGITGKNKEDLLEVLSLTKNIDNLYINNEKTTNNNINKYRQKISLVAKDLVLNTVEENMEEIIKLKNITLKDKNKKMMDSLRLVGLNKTYLTKDINTLSKSELKLVTIAISLLNNPDILIIEEPFVGLDKKYERKIYRVFNKMKEKYNKTIIIFSDDSNTLYKYTNEIIFLYDKEVLIQGNTNSLYTKVDYLKEYKFDIPDIVLFTYKARKKGIKLSYHKDIRDIIKDIYKHV